MLTKIKRVEKLFAKLDKEIVRFAKQSDIHCLPACNACCLKKDMQANVLEFMPLAKFLIENGLHEEYLDALGSNPVYCVNLSYLQVHGELAGCRNYNHRGLICRLFGSSALRNKNSELVYYTCSPIKKRYPEKMEELGRKINGKLKIPFASRYYELLRAIDPVLAEDYNPVNVSITKAIEKVAFYYSFRPKRHKHLRKTG